MSLYVSTLVGKVVIIFFPEKEYGRQSAIKQTPKRVSGEKGERIQKVSTHTSRMEPLFLL